MRKRKVYAIAAIITLTYIFSYGPVIYLRSKIFGSGNTSVDKVTIVVFFPHLIAMGCSRSYYDYINWCFIQGGR